MSDTIERPRRVDTNDLLDDILDGKAFMICLTPAMNRALKLRAANRWKGGVR